MAEQGLAGLFDDKTRLLIVGSFPSVASRGECYYNHPHNLFWPIIAEVFNGGKPLETRAERYACLLKNRIGLWDVIDRCAFVGDRPSSLDSRIIKESIVYNDFSVLRRACPDLQTIVFSSKSSRKLFDGYLKRRAGEELRQWLKTVDSGEALPSTSPANASMKRAEKMRLWQAFFYSNSSSG